MAKFKIQDVKCDVCGYGICADTVNVELELLSSTGKTVYIAAAEVDGFPNIYKTNESVFDKMMNGGAESADAAKNLSKEELENIGDSFFANLNENYALYCSDGYDDFFENKKCCGIYRKAVRYLIYVLRAEWNDMNAFVKKTKGLYLKDLDIPKSDVEEEWEEMQA